MARLSPRIGFAIKLAAGCLIFWLAVRNLNSADLLRRLAAVQPAMFLEAVLFLLAQIAFCAARWSAVSGATGPQALPLRQTTSGTLEATFFNQALPSTVGGDGIRVLRALRCGHRAQSAVIGVVVDRVFGLVALALLVLIGLLLMMLTRKASLALFGASAIAALVVAGAAVALCFPRLLARWSSWSVVRAVVSLSQAIGAVARERRLARIVIGYSLLGQLCSVAAVERLATGISVHFSLIDLLGTVPAILLSAALPISINGWGVREGASVVLLGTVGVAQADALALSILSGLATLAVGAIGGLVWLAEGWLDARWAEFRRQSPPSEVGEIASGVAEPK